MTRDRFRYHFTCTTPGCTRTPQHKIASIWSDGQISELKTYGLACSEHADAQLEAARRKHAVTRLAEGESLAPPTVLPLTPLHPTTPPNPTANPPPPTPPAHSSPAQP
ncbi:MAG: hypothetical protein KatS3mg108_1560 [Isosphaeraceae bacterium]|nr:MAG: hypothetical protein KatS3mg108_1560 [Isosphaeraceae bacterium]